MREYKDTNGSGNPQGTGRAIPSDSITQHMRLPKESLIFLFNQIPSHSSNYANLSIVVN